MTTIADKINAPDFDTATVQWQQHMSFIHQGLNNFKNTPTGTNIVSLGAIINAQLANIQALIDGGFTAIALGPTVMRKFDLSQAQMEDPTNGFVVKYEKLRNIDLPAIATHINALNITGHVVGSKYAYDTPSDVTALTALANTALEFYALEV